MIRAQLYIHDLEGGIYNECEDELSRLPNVGDFVKLDDTLTPYRVDAVARRAGALVALYVTRDTHGVCLRGRHGTVGDCLNVYLPGVAA